MTNSTTEAHKWYCVRSTAGYESRAAELLSRLSPEVLAEIGGLDVYCPQIRKMMPVGGKRRAVLAPLFPGYFFARFGLEQAGRFVASRLGVIGLIRFGDQPATVPSEVILDLKAVYSKSEICFLDTFLPGQRVIIKEGPFSGMEAEYVASLKEGHRALLLLEYLHQRVNLVADRQILESAA